MSGCNPACDMTCPASFASATPVSLNGTSCQPVKRFSRFHVLWPCRSKTRVARLLPVMAVHLVGHAHDLRELVGLQARAADKTAVAQRQLDVRLDIRRVDAAAIDHAHLARGARADELTDDLADEAHRLVGVLRVG